MSALPLLLLAAGFGRRMGGGDKLLSDMQGEALIHRSARHALEGGLSVTVCLPAGNAARRDALADLPVEILEVADPSDGMSAALSAGCFQLPANAPGFAVALADMPDIMPADHRAMATAFLGQETPLILRATTQDGKPGHPVYFPIKYAKPLSALTGDQGARQILKTEPVQYIALPGTHALTDIDTATDLTNWRAAQPASSG